MDRSRIWHRKGAFIAGLLLFAGLPGAPLSAANTFESASAEVAQHTINLAGRQRMLSQRMAKAMCFSLLGIEAQRHSEAAFFASLDFDEVIVALTQGSESRGLPAITTPAIVARIEGLAETSKGLSISVRQVVSGDQHTVPVGLILQLNEPVLKEMNAIVTLIERASIAQGVTPRLASTLNQLGRQRMVSQRIAKNVCFNYIGFGKDAAVAQLGKDIKSFELTLDGLIDGNRRLRLLKAPKGKISGRLGAARFGWQSIKPILEKISTDQPITAVELLQVDLQIDTMFKALDDAVQLWSKNPG